MSGDYFLYLTKANLSVRVKGRRAPIMVEAHLYTQTTHRDAGDAKNHFMASANAVVRLDIELSDGSEPLHQSVNSSTFKGCWEKLSHYWYSIVRLPVKPKDLKLGTLRQVITTNVKTILAATFDVTVKDVQLQFETLAQKPWVE